MTTAAADDGDVPPGLKYVHHETHSATPPPAMIPTIRLQRINELPPEQWSAALQLTHHIAAEGGVLLEEVVASMVAICPCSPVSPHERANQGKQFDGPNERIPFEKAPFDPQQAFEL